MDIAGLQKTTLLDYPGRIACTVFLAGCNLRCPFCHNASLVLRPQTLMSQEELLAFLQTRRRKLDGVCITGGEPTLYQDLPQLLDAIKRLGFLTKLDTNGTRPQALKAVLDAGLVDYVAMDIKNSPDRYGQTAGVPGMPLERIEQSIRFLLQGQTDFEFRTTVADELHDAGAMEAIGKWLTELCPDRKAEKFFLQPYVDRESGLCGGLHTPNREKLLEMADSLAPFVGKVTVRAMD